MYKDIWAVIKSHLLLNVFAVFAMIFCFWYSVYFSCILPLLFSLCLAILSSYIFYIVTVDYKRIQNNKNIFNSIREEGRLIISYRNQLISAFRDYTKVDISEPYQEIEIKAILEKINPNSNDAPEVYCYQGQFVMVTWLQLIGEKMRDTQLAINRIYRFMPFIDTELVEVLSDIEKARLILSINNFISQGIKNENLGFMASYICDYTDRLKKFENYYKKFFLSGFITNNNKK